MGFSIGVIADILKFPWPLFPKYKKTFPIGFRYDIPALATDQTFEIILPLDNNYELRSFAFSSTGYKDGDSYSLNINGDCIFSKIYTKELGQVKDLVPIRLIKSTDTLQFIFHNITGTSKVIWIDLDLTSQKGIHYSDI